MAVPKKLRQFAGTWLRRLGLLDTKLGRSLRGKYGFNYPDLNLPDEARSREAVKRLADYTICSYPRLVNLWEQVRYLDRIGLDGALVECGTYRGGASALMAMAHLTSGAPTRTIHLFDSFAGIPEPDADKDGAAAVAAVGGSGGGRLRSTGTYVGPLETCREAMHQVAGYPVERTVYHVGWFQDTVGPAAAEIGPIALLRLDGDWYESTLVCLDALFPLVVPGGFVVIDDYGWCEGCRRAVHEFLDVRFGDRAPYLHYLDYTGRYFIAP